MDSPGWKTYIVRFLALKPYFSIKKPQKSNFWCPCVVVSHPCMVMRAKITSEMDSPGWKTYIVRFLALKPYFSIKKSQKIEFLVSLRGRFTSLSGHSCKNNVKDGFRMMKNL